ncbi:SNF2 family N-terminal domain-containing protein [Suillus placidus]|uniref:SNF2 family N-terminal domain-containing protein n=1 Tax=Suillus placidus TaxID=48579 RepID=A0A9P6ZKH5_9AGAM|nr:SNF2 family N-terminal domain-containing protein [Suillus placidus]
MHNQPSSSLESPFCPQSQLKIISPAPPPSPIIFHMSCPTWGAYNGFAGADEFAAALLMRLHGVFNAQQEEFQRQQELKLKHWDKINAGGWNHYFNLDYEGVLACLTCEDGRASSFGTERHIPPPWKTTDHVLDVLFWTVNRSGRGKKGKENPVGESNEELELPLELQDQLVKMQLKGEQPSDDCMENVDDFLHTVDKSELDIKDIKYVAWAFIKWDDLSYNEATWDSPSRSDKPGYLAFEAAFQHFIDWQNIFVRKSDKDVKKLDSRVKGGCALYALRQKCQPKLGQDSQLQLMPFQIDGFDWLCDNWWNLQPCILADEMGLGKTVQIVTFLGIIINKWQGAPALVIVPNSTITNWAQDVIIQYELFHPSDKKGGLEPKYHVMVTTYETLINPRDFNSVFKSIPRWEVLVVDEGQCLKSDHSLLFKKLNELHTIHCVIMTGTPLNNNIHELFNLMNFLDPEEWSDLEALEKEHEELNEELVRQLHIRLKPYFLWCIKSEVLQLSPKNEVIVPLSMAPLQKEIYRSILSQNLDILRSLTQVATIKAGKPLVSKANLNNMLMQLRKCLQHLYLNSEDIEPRNLTPAFVMALDIIEDFIRGEGYKYLCLDGNTKQADRQKGMNKFNNPNSDVFIYMLNTVIISDPDFNPHQDLQAIARSHRYGQTKTCLVFKFMSILERIMLMGKKKLVLDHLIVQKMDDDGGAGEDLQSMLTFGAKALFEEGDQSSKDITYVDNDIEKLIEKTEVEGDQQAATKEAGLSFAFAKGDSWALALERIAAAKGAEQVTEVTGRGTSRKAAAIFLSKSLITLKVWRTRPTRAGKRRNIDIRSQMHPAIPMLIQVLFMMRVEEQPHQSDKWRKVLRTIAEVRDSSRLHHFLEEGKDPGDVVASTRADLPRGLNQLGNTCYLNSLLQYFYTIKELCEAVASMANIDMKALEDEKYSEDDLKRHRVGGRLIMRCEILRSKKFVSQLADLVWQLQFCENQAVTPTIDLAKLALVTSRDEEEEADRGGTDSSNNTDVTLVEDVPGRSPDSNGSVLGKRPCDEQCMDMDVDTPTSPITEGKNGYVMISQPSRGSKSPRLHGESLSSTMPLPSPLPDVEMVNHGNSQVEEQKKAPPLPTRKPTQSDSVMMFGKQHDVSECMDNCIFQIEIALLKFDGLGDSDNQNSVVKRRRRLRTLTHEKEDLFSHLPVNVADNGFDIYDGLSGYFDNVIDYEGEKARMEVMLVDLPPLLQIQLQRVQFNRETLKPYKSQAYVKFGKTIYMDRFLDTADPGKRARSKEVQAELNMQRECLRLLTQDKHAPFPASLKSTFDFLSKQETLILTDVDEELVANISGKQDMIEAEVDELKDMISKLKEPLQ